MAFQVRGFEYVANNSTLQWKFKLNNLNHSTTDFYEQEEHIRTLSNLTQDLSCQISSTIDRKKRICMPRDRIIRKLCQKMIKTLHLTLHNFARDIGEDIGEVQMFFQKDTRLLESKKQQLLKSCQSWILSLWLSLNDKDYHECIKKYLQSFIKDGKRKITDFESLNEIYIPIIQKQKIKPIIKDQLQEMNSLLLIDINLTIQNKYISESLLWQCQDEISNWKLQNFTKNFLLDLLRYYQLNIDKFTILGTIIKDQYFIDLEDQIRIQIRTQILYKTLLRKYSNILLNFSTIEIPPQIREYLLPIEIKILDPENQQIYLYEDQFQWDILNENNNVEKFCANLIQDAQLPKKYYSQLCYKIRTQINAELHWKFTLLVRTFKSIHRDRQSPKLNTQTTSLIRKNINYTMDVSLLRQSSEYQINNSSNIYFNNSDLFSLISRNIDILPHQFQQILLQGKQSSTNNHTNKICDKFNSETNKNNFDKMENKVQDNQYLNGVANNYRLNKIWRQNNAMINQTNNSI